MRKKSPCGIPTVVALLVALVSLLAVGCLPLSVPPAEITGRVVITETIESSTQIPALPNDYVFWIVRLSVKNVSYKYPVEVNRQAFYTGGQWTITSRNTSFVYYSYAISETLSLSVGQSGQFIALFAFPRTAKVQEVQVVYQGQEPYSSCALILEGTAEAYNWDNKSSIGKIPPRSYAPLALAILYGVLLAVVRFYPEVSTILKRNKMIRHEIRVRHSRFHKVVFHPISGIAVVIAGGVAIYYLFPLIGSKAVTVALAVAAPLWYVLITRIYEVIQDERWKDYSQAYTGSLWWPLLLKRRGPRFKCIAALACQYVEHGTILDIGTGPGRLPLLLSEMAPHTKCIGVDIRRILLSDAVQDAIKNKCCDRVSFVQANVQALPFADQTFDMVISMFSLHQWRDRKKGVAELYRVLKNEGVVLILVGRSLIYPGKVSIFDLVMRRSAKYLTNVLQDAGFKDIKITYFDIVELQIIGRK
jgi:SAM-dependent methyltransferase